MFNMSWFEILVIVFVFALLIYLIKRITRNKYNIT